MGLMSLLSVTRVALRRRYHRPAPAGLRDGSATRVAPASEPIQGDGASDAEARPREASVKEPTEVTITPYRDGPYLLRGPFILRDQDGAEIPNARRVVALCRCGKSRTRPFCDGTHRLAGFHAPSGPERPLNLAVAGDPA
jgi:CDGSH-type Zn-finger protein